MLLSNFMRVLEEHNIFFKLKIIAENFSEEIEPDGYWVEACTPWEHFEFTGYEKQDYEKFGEYEIVCTFTDKEENTVAVIVER